MDFAKKVLFLVLGERHSQKIEQMDVSSLPQIDGFGQESEFSLENFIEVFERGNGFCSKGNKICKKGNEFC